MGNHIQCMYIMHVNYFYDCSLYISTTYSATLSNLFLWKQRAHNKPGSIPPPPHKRSLALLHKNTARCAGHCFITIDITEKCCPITKTTASRILSQVITDNTFSMVPMYILPHRSGSLLCSEHLAV